VLAVDLAVEQVVYNLVSHAVQYSPPDGAIRVRARLTGGEVEVRVLDEGPGRSAAEAERAFDLFSRSSRSTADPSGANLGLVVGRLLVERMNGRIWAGASIGGELGFALPLAEGYAAR